MPGSYIEETRTIVPDTIQANHSKHATNTNTTTLTNNTTPTATSTASNDPYGLLTSIPSTPAAFAALDSLLITQTLIACGVSIPSSLFPSSSSSPSLRSPPTWSSIGIKNHVSMYQCSTPNSNLYQFLGTTELDATIEMVEEMMRIPSNLKLIDPMCLELNVAARLDNDHHILHAIFQMPPFVTNRDFVWLSVNRRLSNDLFVSAGRSISVSEYGQRNGLVRGEIRASGFVVEAIDDGRRCRMSYVVQADPSGWLPTKLVNVVSKQQAYAPGVIKEKLGQFKKQWNERHPDQRVE